MLSGFVRFPRLPRRPPNLLEFCPVWDYAMTMSSIMTEIMQVCEALPADKQSQLADFARFLLARQDEEAWESRIDYPKTRPRLDAFLHDAAAEGSCQKRRMKAH